MTRSPSPYRAGVIQPPSKRQHPSSPTTSTSSEILQEQDRGPEPLRLCLIDDDNNRNCDCITLQNPSLTTLPALRQPHLTSSPRLSPSSSQPSPYHPPADTSSKSGTQSDADSKRLDQTEEVAKLADKSQSVEWGVDFRAFGDGEGSGEELSEELDHKVSASQSSDDDNDYDGGGTTNDFVEHIASEQNEIMVGTPYQVRDLLRRKWLFINDKDAKSAGASVIAKAQSVLDEKRGSDWSKEKRIQIQEGIEDYCEELEATFVANLMKHLHGDTRKIPKSRGPNEAEFEWIEAAWKKDHLRLRYNIDFLSDCIPKIRTGDAVHDTLIEEVPRVEKPRPDVAFGIYESAFSPIDREILNHHKNILAGPRLYDIFFVIEAKCMNACIEEAENQCIRSGCAMVNTNRLLNQAATKPRKTTSSSSPKNPPALTPATVYPRPDLTSFAFTLAVGSQFAHLFVNWALEMDPKDSVQWHMHFMRAYSYHNPDDLNTLHHDMNNILDWGVGKRKARLIEQCESIREIKAAQQPKTKKQKTEGGEVDAGV